MAVYTSLSFELIADFLQNYDLGKLSRFSGIAEGIENSNFILWIRGENGKEFPAILTLFEQRARREDLPFYLAVMAHLAQKGRNCPQPYTMRDGTPLGILQSRPAVLVRFLEGKNNAIATETRLMALGSEIATMRLAMQDFSLHRSNDFAPHQLTDLYHRVAPFLDSLQQGLRAELAAEMQVMQTEWIALQHRLPQGVIHADLFPDNVFFEGEQLTGIIDFYFAATDSYAFELAITLNAWCFEAIPQGWEFNHSKARALLHGYQQIHSLSAEERDALPFLARGAALRFLLTRAVDWFFRSPDALVTPKDPLEYLAKWHYWKHNPSPMF
jgi:homoserine kinase type II